MIITSVGIIALFCLARPFTSLICSDASGSQLQENCVDEASKWLYVVLAVAAVILIPLQYLFMSIFKAYVEELKNVDDEYEKVH